VIEQAKGFIAATNSIGIDDAFHLLRRYARNHNAAIHAVAHAVVNGGLRL
jgi:AmiR/NasT family two-component response regulator